MSDQRVRAGDTLTFTVAAKKADLTAQDLTGAELRFMAKDRQDDLDASAIISLTIGAGITVTNAAAGLASITIADDVSLAVGIRTLYWALKMKDASGASKTLDAGKLFLLPAIVRAT